MNSNQAKVFWAMFLTFCITATISIYPQGAFLNIDVGSAGILVCGYLIVGFFMRKYVMTNPEKIDKWFQ